jgi:hypothetical protein
VLGKYSTSPTAKEVGKLITSNRNRIKMAERVLEDKIEGRKLSEKEKKEVAKEMENVKKELDEWFQSQDLDELEKNNPEKLNEIYKVAYEQGKVAVRLSDKTTVHYSQKQTEKQ